MSCARPSARVDDQEVAVKVLRVPDYLCPTVRHAHGWRWRRDPRGAPRAATKRARAAALRGGDPRLHPARPRGARLRARARCRAPRHQAGQHLRGERAGRRRAQGPRLRHRQAARGRRDGERQHHDLERAPDVLPALRRARAVRREEDGKVHGCLRARPPPDRAPDGAAAARARRARREHAGAQAPRT